jgi:hypothetical protein
MPSALFCKPRVTQKLVGIRDCFLQAVFAATKGILLNRHLHKELESAGFRTLQQDSTVSCKGWTILGFGLFEQLNGLSLSLAERRLKASVES